jgi:large subunit ribosomal protein L29
MKTRELKDKNKDELGIMLKEKQELSRKLRFDMATKQVKNVREYRNIKKEIARILTLIKEKNGK